MQFNDIKRFILRGFQLSDTKSFTFSIINIHQVIIDRIVKFRLLIPCIDDTSKNTLDIYINIISKNNQYGFNIIEPSNMKDILVSYLQSRGYYVLAVHHTSSNQEIQIFNEPKKYIKYSLSRCFNIGILLACIVSLLVVFMVFIPTAKIIFSFSSIHTITIISALLIIGIICTPLIACTLDSLCRVYFIHKNALRYSTNIPPFITSDFIALQCNETEVLNNKYKEIDSWLHS